MAATLLPDASHALHWIIWGGIDRRPGRAAIVGSGNKRIPFAWKTRCLVISGDIGAKETNRRAARRASDCFDFSCVLDAVRGADVEVVCPVNSRADSMANYYSSVTFWRIASCYRLIVNVGVIDGVV